MAGIDDSLTFYPLRIAVLTISDTRDLADDPLDRCIQRREIERARRPRMSVGIEIDPRRMNALLRGT